MRAGEVLVFVEVRYRAMRRFGGGVGSVDRTKRRRLARAAAGYLTVRNVPAHVPCRFDVIGVSDDDTFEWVPDAFEVESWI